MRIDYAGRISEHFYALGHHGTPIYLLDGPEPVLFDSGYTALAGLYEADIKEVLGNRKPKYLFITHAHFDHVGTAGILKRLYPEMVVACSRKAAEILRRPNAIELIKKLNHGSVEAMRLWGISGLYTGPFEPFEPDLIVSDRQVFELEGGTSIHAFYTPGHTRDFTSYWVPEKKILVASEAVGCDDGTGYIVSEFLVDFDEYKNSMKRLSRLKVRILCPGHRFIFTDQEAEDYIGLSLEHAEAFAVMVEGFLREEAGDIDRTVQRVKAFEWDPRPLPKQPEQPYLINVRARVKCIRDRMLRRDPDLRFASAGP